MVHGCMVYTERAKMAAVSCGTSHASAVSTPLRWIFKNALEKTSHSCRITCERNESARERSIALFYINQQSDQQHQQSVVVVHVSTVYIRRVLVVHRLSGKHTMCISGPFLSWVSVDSHHLFVMSQRWFPPPFCHESALIPTPFLSWVSVDSHPLSVMSQRWFPPPFCHESELIPTPFLSWVSVDSHPLSVMSQQVADDSHTLFVMSQRWFSPPFCNESALIPTPFLSWVSRWRLIPTPFLSRVSRWRLIPPPPFFLGGGVMSQRWFHPLFVMSQQVGGLVKTSAIGYSCSVVDTHVPQDIIPLPCTPTPSPPTTPPLLFSLSKSGVARHHQ